MPATQEIERDTLAAPVLEVFASIQGEGAYVGQPQVFVRLFGCPFRCLWCDTPGSLTVPDDPRARVERFVVHEKKERTGEAAWASPFQVATWVAAAEGNAPRTISVTGGEPLLWPGFVQNLRRYAGSRRIHLETAGGHPEALEAVLESVDHVSLDLKLPADLAPPVLVPAPAPMPVPDSPSTWADARSDCLALLDGRDACAKLPISGDHPAEAYAPLLEDVAGMAPELPCILQPITPMGGATAPSHALLDELCDMALELELHVRVLPQVHRFLKVP